MAYDQPYAQILSCLPSTCLVWSFSVPVFSCLDCLVLVVGSELSRHFVDGPGLCHLFIYLPMFYIDCHLSGTARHPPFVCCAGCCCELKLNIYFYSKRNSSETATKPLLFICFWPCLWPSWGNALPNYLHECSKYSFELILQICPVVRQGEDAAIIHMLEKYPPMGHLFPMNYIYHPVQLDKQVHIDIWNWACYAIFSPFYFTCSIHIHFSF